MVGNQNTENVSVLAPLTNSPGLPKLPLAHLSDTDVWYGSWRIRNNLRSTYRFVVNLKPGQDAQQLATLDPLNPHKMEVSFERDQMPPTQLSIASMPLASEESWIVGQSGSAAGKIEAHALKSAVLGSERKIWIYTPPGY
jgi:enterochelin esterase family protein